MSSSTSLADPASTGVPRSHNGNQGFYVILDQQLYSNASGSETVSAFTRFMGAPSDRNLVDLYIDGGLTFFGLIPGRPNDSFGVAAAYARISDSAKELDRDARNFGEVLPIRDDEFLIEASYIAHIVPGWTVQPNFQYVWNPGGNAADASGSIALENAAVIGIRTTVNY